MKNFALTIALILSANIGFSQFSPTGTATNDNKFRLGAIGIGYSSTPTFGSYKFMVNGTSLFTANLAVTSGGITIGAPTIPGMWSSTNWGVKSDNPFIVSNSTTPFMRVYSSEPTAFAYGDFAIATADYAFGVKAKKGDVIWRGYTGSNMLVNCEGGGGIKFITVSDPTNDTTIYNTTKVQMTITKTGNVGIGTETPDTKLAVNGTVHAKEVVVDLVGWPDYVFEQDYKLMPLEEVEKSINEDKHLPNIPSACEIEENGVPLGEMNKKLMEKVEELTLYIIEMNKEIQKLKEELKN